MRIGFSVFLLAFGAILTFAVETSPDGFNLNVVGVIIMITGGVWLLLTLFRRNAAWPFRRNAAWPGRRRIRIIDEDTGIEEERLESDPPGPG